MKFVTKKSCDHLVGLFTSNATLGKKKLCFLCMLVLTLEKRLHFQLVQF